MNTPTSTIDDEHERHRTDEVLSLSLALTRVSNDVANNRNRIRQLESAQKERILPTASAWANGDRANILRLVCLGCCILCTYRTIEVAAPDWVRSLGKVGVQRLDVLFYMAQGSVICEISRSLWRLSSNAPKLDTVPAVPLQDWQKRLETQHTQLATRIAKLESPRRQWQWRLPSEPECEKILFFFGICFVGSMVCVLTIWLWVFAIMAFLQTAMGINLGIRF